jgi:hypothetical protein
MEIVADGNLFAFFHERVSDARQSLSLDVGDEAEFYLVHLLVRFLRTHRLLEHDGQRVDDRPLAIRLLQGRQAGGDRIGGLKHLADTTLYVLGCFSESLRRSPVDLRYYAGVGESAYGSLAALQEQRSSGAGAVFWELSDRFTDCVELLTEVRDQGRTDTDLLARYEDFLALGEDRAARRLRGLGVISVPDGESH